MNMTPRQVVAELDKFIIGQDEAKKAVAIALRNRYRRSQVTGDMHDEITPKNIIMKGPTGVGKTEIARRLARLVKAPFIKVEATKYTEVGYVGRDVESMIRDLAEVAVRMVKEERFAEISVKARAQAAKKVVSSVVAARKKNAPDSVVDKNLIEQDILAGKIDGELIEIKVPDAPKQIDIMPGMGAAIDLSQILGGMMPKRTKERTITVKEAMEILTAEESESMIDMDSINDEAIRRAEHEGIIFIDEIDKIAHRANGSGGPDVSREGVQRDILPIVEGCSVQTKYGVIRTDYILFIASGAFHVAAIDDLIPELQGRFPIRVELQSLTKEDFVRILTQPVNAVTKQYAALLAVDHVNLIFCDDAIEEIADICVLENLTCENTGARRLHTILEALLEDISYNASGEFDMVDVKVDRNYVREHLSKTVKRLNLKKYVL